MPWLFSRSTRDRARWSSSNMEKTRRREVGWEQDLVLGQDTKGRKRLGVDPVAQTRCFTILATSDGKEEHPTMSR